VDRNFLEIAQAQAGHRGLRLTDVVEEGLLLYCKQEGTVYDGKAARLRFLAARLPKDLEALVLASLTYFTLKQEDDMLEHQRLYFQALLERHSTTPQHEACLAELMNWAHEKGTKLTGGEKSDAQAD
jgi:hypothetical protein